MNKKTYLLAGLAAMLAAACTNDDLDLNGEGGNGSTPQQSEEGYIIQGIREEGLYDAGCIDMDSGEDIPATRMAIDNNGRQHWEVNDQISLSHAEGGDKVKAYKVSETSNGNSTFVPADESSEGLLVATNAGADDAFYALYPELAISGTNRGKWTKVGEGENATMEVSTMVFTEQDYEENFSKFGSYMVGQGTVEIKDGVKNLDLVFNALTSIIEVDLTGLELNYNEGECPVSVTIKAKEGACIAGMVTYNFGTGKATVSTSDNTPFSTNSQSDIVKVSNLPKTWNQAPAEGEQRLVRFHLLPVQLSGIVVSIEITNGYRNYSKSKTVTATIGTGTGLFQGLERYGSESKTANSCSPYYKTVNWGKWSKGKAGDWMSGLPGDIYFSLLSLPGAHAAGTEKLTEEEGKCQDLPIYNGKTKESLLLAGCRALDLCVGVGELSVGNPTLYLAHGDNLTTTTLSTALDSIKSFLTVHPTEAVFVRLHREERSTGYSPDEQEGWSKRMYAVLSNATYKNYLVTDLHAGTTLQDCRGKMVIVSCDRIGYPAEGYYYGCTAALYPNAASSVEMENGTGNAINDLVLTYQNINKHSAAENTQGLYCSADYPQIRQAGGVQSHSGKIDIVKKVMNEAMQSSLKEGYSSKRVFLNYCNWTFGTTTAKYNAQLITPAVNSHIMAEGSNGCLGVMMADYLGNTATGGDAFIGLVIRQNFDYLFAGRTRIQHPGYELNETVIPNTGGLILHDPTEGADGSHSYAPAFRH